MLMQSLRCRPRLAPSSFTRPTLCWNQKYTTGDKLDAEYDRQRFRVRVAVLYQELDPPLINGVRKPKKPGGYQDSGADIAYVLKHRCPDIDVVTPVAAPNPAKDSDWVFPDSDLGFSHAIEQDATHIWANTILFANHPLQIMKCTEQLAKHVNIVGQPPKLVELYDDKAFVNDMLRAKGTFRLPAAVLVRNKEELENALSSWNSFPVVGKPARGRGSHGVKVCRTADELRSHSLELLNEQSSVIIEEYLAGVEGTVTVMPPSPSLDKSDYWALPVVERFNHADGIAPYNGIVAVTQNSWLVTEEEHKNDSTYSDIQRQCVEAARLLQCTAPIRIDVRRISENKNSPFALFDVNMKPNMTGPGRPGRENQASLTAMAAAGIGWDYPTLLEKILASSSTLHDLRNVQVPE